MVAKKYRNSSAKLAQQTHEQPQPQLTNHNSTMTCFQLALASEGSLPNNFQRGVSKPTRNAVQQPGRGRMQNLHSSKQIAAQKSSLSPPRIN